jgi:hypothetical protein
VRAMASVRQRTSALHRMQQGSLACQRSRVSVSLPRAWGAAFFFRGGSALHLCAVKTFRRNGRKVYDDRSSLRVFQVPAESLGGSSPRRLVG